MMSTTMVGEETEIETVSAETDNYPREIKKGGLINSFFQPVVKSKENLESKLETERPLSIISVDDNKKKISTQIIHESNHLDLCEGKEKFSNMKSRNDHELSSQEEHVKPKQTKPKWTVTCTVRNTSKYLSSSGSEFEDDGKSFLMARSEETQKSGKKKEKAGQGSEFETQEFKGNSFVNGEKKAVKKTRTLVKKQKIVTGINCSSSTRQSDPVDNKNENVKGKGSSSIRNHQAKESKKTSMKPGSDQDIELRTGIHVSSVTNESNDLSRCKEAREARTSAFDVLMKSQRALKTEDQRPKSSLCEDAQSIETPCEVIEDNSCSCEITDVKSNFHSEETVFCQSKSSKGEAPSERIEKNCSSRTNAFDLLMKKGKIVNSPCSVDSQGESELESDAKGITEASLKKKPKKKSFEFQLSIRASNKKDIEFSFESGSVSIADNNCQENNKGKRTKKRRKIKKNDSDAGEGGSDQSFVKESSGNGEDCKSKRVRKKFKVESADVSISEVNFDEEKLKGAQKKKRKPRRKSASSTDVIAMDIYPDQEKQYDEIESLNSIARKKARIKGNIEEDHEDIIENSRKKKKARRSDRDISPPQQTVASKTKNKDTDVGQIKKQHTKKSFSNHNTKKGTANAKTKIDEKIEMETGSKHQKETSVSNDPKPSAAILLNKKTAPSKLDVTQENQTDSKSASVTSGTSPSTISADVTDKPNTVNKEPSHAKDKCAEEKETATQAFKALFADSSYRKTAPMVGFDKVLLVDRESSLFKEKSAEEKEAANCAFKALFVGASSQKAASVSVVEACPAPWPSVSHVLQKDQDGSPDGRFWYLPWPVGKGRKFDVSWQCDLLLKCPPDNVLCSTSPLIIQKVLADVSQSLGNSSFMEKKRAQRPLPEAVIKKILSELALFYPGVPLRKLYKRYATKLQRHKVATDSMENKQLALEKNVLMVDEKKNEVLESKEELQEGKTKSLPFKKGRAKRRLSCDDGVSQERKIARKSGDFSATLPSKDQGPLGDQSAKTLCKKRQREEDNQSQEKTCKGRRLSSRLQEKKKTSVEEETLDNSMPEQTETSSNRRNEKITTDCNPNITEMPAVSKEQDICTVRDAVMDSKSDKSVSPISDSLWADVYRPVHSTEVMANASAVSKLRSWLEEWKIKREKTLRKEIQQQKRLLAKQKGKSSSSKTSGQTLDWWDADSDSDFQMSDGDSENSDTEGGGLTTAMFISGPAGAGKTAMVYACAEELGYKVFEVNSASKRSGKNIISQLEEATQSHLVISSKPPTSKGPVSADLSFTGLFSKPVENSSPARGPLGTYFQSAATASQSKSKKEKAVKRSKGKKVKERKERLKGKTKSILKQSSQSLSEDGTESNLSSKAASLILFEEVDVIFEEDKSFWMAVNSFMQNAKCPIVLISSEPQVSCEGRYDQINLKPPSVNLLAAHLQLVGLMNNMFINPEDLKSMVAHNNCDIRKSLLNLQFWSASGGGFRMPYERPASLNDTSNKKQTTQPLSSAHVRNTECVMADSTVSREVPHLTPIMTGGVLDEGGEESMFLSLSDWQVIKNGGLRRSLRSSRSGSFKPNEGENSDSDLCEPKKKTLVCADGSTDSIFEITDTNDSQPVSSSVQRPDDSLQLPPMDGLLCESFYGFLNCLDQPAKGSLSVLQNNVTPGHAGKDSNLSEKLHLTHFGHVHGVDLSHTNMSSLLPLFIDPSVSQQKDRSDQLQAKESHCAVPPDTAKDGTSNSKNIFSGIFSDTSLFDDGIEPSVKNVGDKRGPKGEEEESNKGSVSVSQDSTDTGFSESQAKEELGERVQEQDNKTNTEVTVQNESKLVHRKLSQQQKCASRALDIFAQFAENMSFGDAYCSSLFNTQSDSAQFGWWGARLKPGLTDEHVSVQESKDWLVCDTRTSIRGALEVANLEDCFVKIKDLYKDIEEIGNSPPEGETPNGRSVLCDFCKLSEFLPPCDSSNVLRLDTVNQTQKRSAASRRKLYSSVQSCVPVLNHCNHCSVVCDYIPTFRLLCHSERLREAAHTKRRFLHYLDYNSFPTSRSYMDALADCYMVS